MTWSLYLAGDSKYKIMPSAHNLAFLCWPGASFKHISCADPTLACPGANCWLRPSRRGTFRSLSARSGNNNNRLYHPVTPNLQHITIKLPRKRLDQCNATCVKFVNGQMWQGCCLDGCRYDTVSLLTDNVSNALTGYFFDWVSHDKKWSNQISLKDYLKSGSRNTSPCH